MRYLFVSHRLNVSASPIPRLCCLPPHPFAESSICLTSAAPLLVVPVVLPLPLPHAPAVATVVEVPLMCCRPLDEDVQCLTLLEREP